MESLGSAHQAAAIAAELIALQNGPCDLACIYDARCGTGIYSSLFNPLTQKPHKAYYAFMAFNELRRRGTAIYAGKNAGAQDSPVAYSAAARGEDGSIAVMLANPGGLEVPFTLDVAGGGLSSDGRRGAPAAPARCRITDETRTWAEIPLPDALPKRSILLVEFP